MEIIDDFCFHKIKMVGMEYCLYCDEMCHIESNRSRVCIWLEVEDDYDYFVILDVRKTFVLLWTTFVAEHSHEVRKKQKEYEAWSKAVGNRSYTPDELIGEIMERLP